MLSKTLARRRSLRQRITLAGIVFICLVVTGQSVTYSSSPDLDLLIVDQTRGFAASLQVNRLAAELRQTGAFDTEVVFEADGSSFDLALGPNRTPRRYEIVLVIPRDGDLQRLRQIWIASCPLHQVEPSIRSGVERIQAIVDGQRGPLQALSVADDALPGWLATSLERTGWLNCASGSSTGGDPA